MTMKGGLSLKTVCVQKEECMLLQSMLNEMLNKLLYILDNLLVSIMFC